jgi:carboxymethylenebutenolidase
MCFADGQLAPAAPGAGTAGEQQAHTLTAADGNVLLAHTCRSATPTSVGFVVLPDVRGLHAYYRDLTVRLAELGWDAVAIDYFGRTAGSGPDADRSETFGFMEHVQQTTREGIAADVAAAAAHLRGLGAERVFTLGFCFGGSASWSQSADTPGLAGCIGFYGRPAGPMQVVDRMRAPLLLLHAGADPNIPAVDVQLVVDAAPVAAELVVFDGLPHSFFDRTSAEHAVACTQAWGHVTRFVGRLGR